METKYYIILIFSIIVCLYVIPVVLVDMFVYTDRKREEKKNSMQNITLVSVL